MTKNSRIRISLYGTIKVKTLAGVLWGLGEAAPFFLAWAIMNIISNISANIRGIKEHLEDPSQRVCS